MVNVIHQAKIFILNALAHVFVKRNIRFSGSLFSTGLVHIGSRYFTDLVEEAIEYLIECQESVFVDICLSTIESYYKERFFEEFQEKIFLELVASFLRTALHESKTNEEAGLMAYDSLVDILSNDPIEIEFTFNEERLNTAAMTILSEDEHQYKTRLREVIQNRIRLADSIKSSLNRYFNKNEKSLGSFRRFPEAKHFQAQCYISIEDILHTKGRFESFDDIMDREDRFTSLGNISNSLIARGRRESTSATKSSDAFAFAHDVARQHNDSIIKQLEPGSTCTKKCIQSSELHPYSSENKDKKLDEIEGTLNKSKNINKNLKSEPSFIDKFYYDSPEVAGDENSSIYEYMQPNGYNSPMDFAKATAPNYKTYNPGFKDCDGLVQNITAVELQSDLHTSNYPRDLWRSISYGSEEQNNANCKVQEWETMTRNFNQLKCDSGKIVNSVEFAVKRLCKSEINIAAIFEENKKQKITKLVKDQITETSKGSVFQNNKKHYMSKKIEHRLSVLLKQLDDTNYSMTKGNEDKLSDVSKQIDDHTGYSLSKITENGLSNVLKQLEGHDEGSMSRRTEHRLEDVLKLLDDHTKYSMSKRTEHGLSDALEQLDKKVIILRKVVKDFVHMSED